LNRRRSVDHNGEDQKNWTTYHTSGRVPGLGCTAAL
jgi:hypothetical protein